MPTPATKSGTKKLSDVARTVVAPRDIVSTEWPAVRQTCEQKLGIQFDDWQHGAGRLILAKRADGNLAAMVDGVGLSLPRQVGKTYLIGAMIFALCINKPGLLVIWSAHHARTHGETFLSMQGFADRAKVKAYVRQVFVGSGDEEIRFHNGSRILFGARERGFGRGIPGVDILVFDEGQILSDRALTNMLATLNTSKFGLQLYIGTPPRPEDMSEVFERMRIEAKGGTLHDGAWIEFGADPKSDPSDRKQWAKANPSYPKRTPAQSIMRLQRKLTEPDFLREGMGIWNDREAARESVFGAGNWNACGNRDLTLPTPIAIGVAATVDQESASIGAAGQLEDDRICYGSVERRPGTAWAVAESVRIQNEHGCEIVVDEKGPAGHLIEPIEQAGGRVTRASLAIYLDACAAMDREVREHAAAHTFTDELDKAVAGATWRTVGDRRAFARKTSDISMLEACALAGSVVRNGTSAYEDRGLLVL